MSFSFVDVEFRKLVLHKRNQHYPVTLITYRSMSGGLRNRLRRLGYSEFVRGYITADSDSPLANFCIHVFVSQFIELVLVKHWRVIHVYILTLSATFIDLVLSDLWWMITFTCSATLWWIITSCFFGDICVPLRHTVIYKMQHLNDLRRKNVRAGEL